MRLLYRHSPAQPVTHVSLLLPRTGVCLEPGHLRGVSRLMARLLFMGAGGLTNRELNSRLERLGASAGCSLASAGVRDGSVLSVYVAPHVELIPCTGLGARLQQALHTDDSTEASHPYYVVCNSMWMLDDFTCVFLPPAPLRRRRWLTALACAQARERGDVSALPVSPDS